MTNEGYMGIAPMEAEVEDVVVVVQGGQVPFVLRKGGKEDAKWRLVGECYVGGLMNGKVMKSEGDEEGKRWVTRDFELI